MITEASIAATLEVSIVLHESDLERLSDTLLSLHGSIVTARAADLLGAAKVVLIDNQSSPTYRTQLAARLQALHPDFAFSGQAVPGLGLPLQLELLDSNEGFGAGHNHGLLRSAAEVFLVLNPDVELAPTALAEGLSLLQSRPDVVALNPQCTGGSGAREYLCKRYPSVVDLLLRGFAGANLRRRFTARLKRYEYQDLVGEDSQLVQLLSGACLLCRGSAFRAVKGFDSRYFMYFEDFDLSLRLATLGQLNYLPCMRIVHHGGYAAGKGLRHIRWFVASGFRFFGRHGWKVF